MDDIQKFLRKVDKKLREQLLAAMRNIRLGQNIDTLDIKPLEGKKGWFRCRVRDARIIYFQDAHGKNILYKADFRGSVYKR